MIPSFTMPRSLSTTKSMFRRSLLVAIRSRLGMTNTSNQESNWQAGQLGKTQNLSSPVARRRQLLI